MNKLGYKEKIQIADNGLVTLQTEGKSIFFNLMDIILIKSEKSRYEDYPNSVEIVLRSNTKLLLSLSKKVYDNLLDNYKRFL